MRVSAIRRLSFFVHKYKRIHGEAFAELLRRGNHEAGGLFVVERAKAFIVDACLAEGDKFFHDIDDVGGAHDAFYGFSVYHSFSDFKKSRGRAKGGKIQI